LDKFEKKYQNDFKTSLQAMTIAALKYNTLELIFSTKLIKMMSSTVSFSDIFLKRALKNNSSKRIFSNFMRYFSSTLIVRNLFSHVNREAFFYCHKSTSYMKNYNP
jgi:hypothetical protein